MPKVDQVLHFPSFYINPRNWSAFHEIIAFIESLPVVFCLFIGLGKFQDLCNSIMAKNCWESENLINGLVRCIGKWRMS